MSALPAIAKPTLNAVPILPSLNFSQTRDFYVLGLGFEEVNAACDDYLVVQKDGMELHFWLSDDPMQCQNSSVFFRSGSPSQIYQDLRDRGIETVTSSSMADGPVRFYVRDPHGNMLMFAGAEGCTH